VIESAKDSFFAKRSYYLVENKDRVKENEANGLSLLLSVE
jgi:hypothetical protein